MNDENRENLERQARALLISREITEQNRLNINKLMKDQKLLPEEKFSEIVKILKDAPEKNIAEVEDDYVPERENHHSGEVKSSKSILRKRKKNILGISSPPLFPDINGPTETKLYIDDIYIKYKKFKFFKKRYLITRNNRIGFGFRKRLIPSKRLLGVLSEIHSSQKLILSRLPAILESILKDESIEGPLEFNYLRLFRKWMLDFPFASLPFEKVKWMEQWNFEREFRFYVINFFSFMKIDMEHREKILLLVEAFLRNEPDLIKEEILSDDDQVILVRKEKRNYAKEKQIFEFMGTLRSFIALPGEGDSLIADSLRKKYDVYTLGDLINMVVEALIFQRPYTASELENYYSIRPIVVSSEQWDYSQKKLQEFGKDPESRIETRIIRLKSELLWYDEVHQMLNLKDDGQNILLCSADEQWELFDNINRDAKDVASNNFIVYMEGLVNYFRHLIQPMLNGLPIQFDCSGKEVSGALFERSFFKSELQEVEYLNEDIYMFRNNNPTLKISGEEINLIINQKVSSMNHVARLLFKAGSLFYSIAEALHEIYNSHLTAYASGQGEGVQSRVPLKRNDEDKNSLGRLIPFSSCCMKSFEESTPLLRRMEGKKIIDDSQTESVFIFITAYCYQFSHLCGYAKIREDMSRREMLKNEIESLKNKIENE